MPKHDLQGKLAILADAAKYDASCASSGSTKRGSKGETKGVGSITGAGICHSYAPDGRCISLLKILLTNHCVYDCLYCVNRVSSDVERARFTPEEVVKITLDFYKRNYIEGLFLSSGIIRTPDYTMEQLVRVAKLLREEHHFRGYIHLKTIPEADPQLIEQAGLYADRLSFNVELPREQSLAKLAPQKQAGTIRKAMGGLRLRLEEAADEKKSLRHARRFAPAGQSTQMIVGADGESDRDIISSSVGLYSGYNLKRVYYSAYSPIPGSSQGLPAKKPPLMREHRLYQADWLYRFYDFTMADVLDATTDGMLDLDLDPKLAWALKHRAVFPVDVNTAPREQLLRIPGLGVKSVDKILRVRRLSTLRFADVLKLTKSIKTMQSFMTASDWHPGQALDRAAPATFVPPEQKQLALF
ncbi:putative DNA modification/repair radical SAM protein [Lichenihabitans sp. Uapishka_5]|uniref:putative DNA modification/repair radical SAM protein n=1 Tax=Lichenihabitans sp. Uapishka_5 TaxID=3037302 RepID=UPI0029E7D191|nr:putative DNA modification/repair radical SAM protein [Lichenihabitans sp. Uapishka_5]MDX7953123.1 putative DNA modification/repair radical SAM protein [Lichenihabitans sp. Uapishka_5]